MNEHMGHNGVYGACEIVMVSGLTVVNSLELPISECGKVILGNLEQSEI
jgi:hypothetical protein